MAVMHDLQFSENLFSYRGFRVNKYDLSWNKLRWLAAMNVLKETYLLRHDGLCGYMLHLLDTPSISLTQLLQILQVIILQVELDLCIQIQICKCSWQSSVIGVSLYDWHGAVWRVQVVRNGEWVIALLLNSGHCSVVVRDLWCFDYHRRRPLLCAPYWGTRRSCHRDRCMARWDWFLIFRCCWCRLCTKLQPLEVPFLANIWNRYRRHSRIK